MFRKRCRECNAELPTSAQFCPHCGVRSPLAGDPLAALDHSDSVKRADRFNTLIKKLTGGLGLLLLVFGYIAVQSFWPKSATETKISPPPTAAEIAKKNAEEAEFQRYVALIGSLKKNMKNPASFKLEDAIRMKEGTLCISYRATNSFNAVMPGRAVIVNNKFIGTSDGDDFAPIWNRHCANKTGTSYRHIRWALW